MAFFLGGSVGSPKSASKNPINLDAIFVCKKIANSPEQEFNEYEVLNHYHEYLQRFYTAGRELSDGDRKVILASQLCKASSMANDEQSELDHRLIQAFSGKAPQQSIK